MVKTINKSVCRGVAGKRSGKVKGVVMHNTWDNQTAEWHMNRLSKMTANQLEAGFAHYYVDENTVIRTEDTYNMAWHTANSDGNANYIGFEIRDNRSTSKAVLLQSEQNACWQAAIDLKYYGLPVNRNTVRLHHEFSATECPKASLIAHCNYDSTYKVPQDVTNKMKDYFIEQIKKYYNDPKLQPDGKASTGNSDTTVTKPTVKPKPEVSKPAPTLKGNNLAAKGYYTVTVNTNIRSKPSTSASIVGSYSKGKGFNYDSKVTSGGYVWLSYISYSGVRRYVAVV